MILVALGSNRSGPWGNPEETVTHALRELDRNGMRLVGASRLMVTAPFGKPNQPLFVNAVARVSTHLPPEALLARLHAIEKSAGRRRHLRWGSRTLDLDIIDYHGLIRPAPSRLVLPHPGIRERVFVLKPIAELAPGWLHPVVRESAKHLLRRLKGVHEGAEI
jgi:2-amino-4-hydroxy-6-hydroxymethyldihydropteridine diphosphokinase